MPAFTAVATLVVYGGLIGTAGLAIGTVAANFLVGVIATGLAAMTSRLINGSQRGNVGQNQGVRITIPPATNNKIPVIYGSVFQQGIVTDARISNENKTMTYVLILAEKTQTGTYTIGDIYWQDTKLNFSGSTVTGRQVPDENGNLQTDTKWNEKIRIRVYAGSQASTDQIFPTGEAAVSARTMLNESDTDYNLNNLVFAVLQMDYDSENGLTGLGQVTFQVQNSLKQPGSVWQDYMSSTRYGAGFDITELNTSTVAALNTLAADTTGLIQYESDGITTSTQARYEINGILSTGETIKNNLERINMASASWTTYDYGEGQWKIIPNRQATVGEKAAAFHFTDDNILSEITLSVTPLEDQYNKLEVEFPDRGQLDQFNYFRDELDPADLNDLEPVNELRLRLELVNNAIHAGRVGRIEMRQSRVDYVLSFTADYSAIQCQVGDVVKITNSVYGFDADLFRVTRVREVESDDGGLVAEIILLQYSDDVYSEASLTDFAVKPISDIPIFGSVIALPAPAAPTVTTSTANAVIPSVTVQTIIPSGSQPITGVEVFASTGTSGVYNFFGSSVPSSGVYTAGDSVQTQINTLPTGDWYFKSRLQGRNQTSNLSTASSVFLWRPASPGSSVQYSATTGSVTVTEVKFTPDGFTRNTKVATVSFISPVTGQALVTYSGEATYTEADAVSSLGEGFYSLQNDLGTFDGFNRLSFSVANSATISVPIVTTRSFPIQAATTASFSLYASKISGSDTYTIDKSQISVVVTAGSSEIGGGLAPDGLSGDGGFFGGSGQYVF